MLGSRSRQSPRQGRRRRSRQENEEIKEVVPQQAQRRSSRQRIGEEQVGPGRSRGRSVSRDSLVEPAGPNVENRERRGYGQQQQEHEEDGGHRRKEGRGRAQSREELKGGRRVEEGKQSLAGEFIGFYLGRAKK